MRQAVRLAARAMGHTSPNPMVGAVIVRDGKVVGRGWHPGKGQPHAEIFALDDADDLAQGATLYVTLEPCCHQGSTGPCTEAIIRHGIRRVVAAVHDPNPLVNGGGFTRLRAAGIETELGVLGDEAKWLSEAHNKWVTTGVPFVTIKMACSLDGKIATRTGESRWITGEETRASAHLLRQMNDVVLVGVNTVLRDDPALTVRLPGGRNPRVVILDTQARTPAEATLFKTEPGRVLIATTAAAPGDRVDALRARGAEVVAFPATVAGQVEVGAVMRHLGEQNRTSVLVEGGGTVAASLVFGGHADKIVLMVAPLLIGGREAPTVLDGAGAATLREAYRVRDLQVRHIGDDLVIEGYLCSPA